MYKKFLILLFLLPVMLFAWVGSDAVVRLVYPRSYSYEPTADWTEREEPFTWQPYFVAGGVYGIVYNPTQGIDKHQIILKDLTTDETALVKEVEGHNSNISGILTGGDLVKAKQDVVIGRKYELTLRAWDLNGDSFDDTAIIRIQRRQ